MKLIFIFLLLPLQIFAQDLTGLWTGYLQTGDTKIPYELAISGKKNELTGYSMMVFTINGVENIGVKTMDMKMKRGHIAFEDGDLIYDNYSTPGRRVKLTGSLAWVGKDANMTLAGSFATRSTDMRAPNENAYKGTVFLQRKKTDDPKRLIAKLNEMGLLDKLSFLPQHINKSDTLATAIKNASPTPVVVAAPAIKERKTAIIRRVLFSADSIVISLYDNGFIDGDTVSILLDGKIILSRQGLTAKAITKTIYTRDIADSAQLVMFAENLGSIPPNTGLLILQAGYERYQVRFSGDLENSSAIILKRRHD